MTDPGRNMLTADISGRLRLMVMAPWVGVLAYSTLVSRRRVQFDQIRRVASVQAQYIAIRSSRTDAGPLTVVDEGPLHALYSCLFGTLPTRVSGWLLRHLIRRIFNVVDSALLISIDKASAAENFLSREQSTSRFSGSTDADLLAAFLADDTYEEIVSTVLHVRKSALIVAEDSDTACERLSEILPEQNINSISTGNSDRGKSNSEQ